MLIIFDFDGVLYKASGKDCLKRIKGYKIREKIRFFKNISELENGGVRTGIGTTGNWPLRKRIIDNATGLF